MTNGLAGNGDGVRTSGSAQKMPDPSKEKHYYYSQDLFRDTREIIIVHNDAHYRLKITKSGKLILNK